MKSKSTTRITASQMDKLADALRSRSQVSGLTHTFYKYPARFSPEFAKAVIETLSLPGDVVVDPFMGGGTTLVEALASGRAAVGCDINPLAGFISSVKTSPLNERESVEIRQWQRNFAESLNLHHKNALSLEWAGYDKHVPWWIRKTIQHGLDRLLTLPSERQQMFARCTLARTAQWALDCGRKLPSSREFLLKHEEHVSEMLHGDAALRSRLKQHHGRQWRSGNLANRRLFVRSTAGLPSDPGFPKSWKAPRLVVTSPPYVGVHILYHRWQVGGRKETPAPYWIAGHHNGQGASHYTFGGRTRGLDGYLPAMRNCFDSINALMSTDTLLVQLVAFSDPTRQLPAYLKSMEDSGFRQCEQLPGVVTESAYERTVPNRKWYADAKRNSGASREFLLLHYKAPP